MKSFVFFSFKGEENGKDNRCHEKNTSENNQEDQWTSRESLFQLVVPRTAVRNIFAVSERTYDADAEWTSTSLEVIVMLVVVRKQQLSLGLLNRKNMHEYVRLKGVLLFFTLNSLSLYAKNPSHSSKYHPLRLLVFLFRTLSSDVCV